MSTIEVIPVPPEGTPLVHGFGRRRAFETESVRVGESRIGPGASSAWHHHGMRNLYGYVVSGALSLEFGRGGSERVWVPAGAFVHIPPGLVHRDVNDTGSETVIVNVVIGEGAPTIEVEGPES
jgi:quercetin dioxygenase-like cupin family protein